MNHTIALSYPLNNMIAQWVFRDHSMTTFNYVPYDPLLDWEVREIQRIIDQKRIEAEKSK